MSQKPEEEIQLASRKRRIAAYIIDYFFITILMVLTVFLIMKPNFAEADNFGAIFSTIGGCLFLGFLLYFSKDFIRGTSLGKWVMGITVRDMNNASKTPSLGRLFLRNLFLIIWPAEFIVLAASSDKMRLGDKTAKTIVIRAPRKSPRIFRILVVIGIGLTFFFCTFLLVISIIKSSGAYQLAVTKIEQNDEIIAETGGIKGYGFMPMGSIQINNGYGRARLRIKVLGDKQDLYVSVYLTKSQGGEWRLVEMTQ